MKKSINEQLKDLYQSKWEVFSNELQKIVDNDEYPIKPTNPLLLRHVDCASYESADIRVMIIGQETNDWEGIFYNDIEKISSVYQDFYPGYKYGYRGFFRNHFNLFLSLLEQKFPNKKISCFWNNVIKVGKSMDRGTPTDTMLEIEQKYFSVLEEEIKIIKPNLILFYSGNNYDTYVLKKISNTKLVGFNGFDLDKLAKLEIKGVKYSFRTSHPQRLHFSGKSNYEKIYENIISEISF